MTTDPLRMSRFTGAFHALLRIVTGLLFLEHGAMKLFGFPPSEMPRPPVGSLFWIGGVMELVGGLLVMIGLFTRPVAFLLAGEMAVAYWMVHAPQSPYPAINQGDAAILFCFVFLFLAAAGSGPWAVDREARMRRASDFDN
ncbi:MAG TPA: DoxX family protein [Novosphingobium sp.]|nr:DoxX family protein [Novosphingobium sp.]